MRIKKKTKELERQLRVSQIDYQYRNWWYSLIRRCTQTLTTAGVRDGEPWMNIFVSNLKNRFFSNNLRKIEARRG